MEETESGRVLIFFGIKVNRLCLIGRFWFKDGYFKISIRGFKIYSGYLILKFTYFQQ